jgi:sugar/nucleoside kinase (ribokinase family)
MVMPIKQIAQPTDTFDLYFPEGKPFDAVGFGLNAVDHLCVVEHFPQFDTKSEILDCRILAGGQVATALTFLARMGLKAKYIGKVGSDDLGRLSLQSIAAEKIDVSSVKIGAEARNQYAFIIIEKGSGERTILWQRDPRLSFSESELSRAEICSGRVLYLDGYDQPAALTAARWAQAAGIPVVADLDKVVPYCRELLQNIDFLITSANFPSEFTGIMDFEQSLAALRPYCRGFIAATLGAKGSAALIGDRCIYFPGHPVQAADTTGAGDIFHGAFLYGLLQNWPVQKIVRFANVAAALNCRFLGARGGIAGLAEILSKL